jgi:hypothetical protein
MLANAHVPLVVPSRTKYGDRPYDERRRMIRMCCGRYEMRIPSKMKLKHTQSTKTRTRQWMRSWGRWWDVNVQGESEVGVANSSDVFTVSVHCAVSVSSHRHVLVGRKDAGDARRT